MQSIGDYLKEHHPQYRQPAMRKLYEGIRALKDAAYRGRLGLVEGTRELLFTPMPYVAVLQHTRGRHRDLAHLSYVAGPRLKGSYVLKLLGGTLAVSL